MLLNHGPNATPPNIDAKALIFMHKHPSFVRLVNFLYSCVVGRIPASRAVSAAGELSVYGKQVETWLRCNERQ